MNKDELITIGADFGMGALKLRGEQGGLQFLSQTAIAGDSEIRGGVFGMRKADRPLLVSGEFGRFYAGKDAHDFGQPVESVDFDRLTGTPEMRALWYGSLTSYQRQYGRFERPLSLVIGLPFQMMQGEGALEYQAAVRKWVKGKHDWYADGERYEVEVGRAMMAPQAMGAVFDYAFDFDGNVVPGRDEAIQKETGTVSIGFNTTELFVAERNASKERFVGGENVGVRWLLSQLKQRRNYSLGELDRDLRSGELDVNGSMEQWWVAVNGFINDRWGRTHERFEKVFLVGGGAILLKNYLTAKFKLNAWVCKDPVMVIANGLYKAGLLKK